MLYFKIDCAGLARSYEIGAKRSLIRLAVHPFKMAVIQYLIELLLLHQFSNLQKCVGY